MSWIPSLAETYPAGSAVRVIRALTGAAGSMRSTKKRWAG
jgi:hypothetical protein